MTATPKRYARQRGGRVGQAWILLRENIFKLCTQIAEPVLRVILRDLFLILAQIGSRPPVACRNRNTVAPAHLGQLALLPLTVPRGPP